MSSVRHDVIVIGAGLSGLSAARRILQRDPTLDVVVLEANNRVGGRTLTMDVGKGTMDLGGQWVSVKQRHVMELIRELGLETYKQNIKGTKIMQVGDDVVRTYTSEIPSLGSWLAVIEMQLIIWRIEALVKKVDIADPYASPIAVEMDAESVASYMNKHVRYKSVRDTFNAAMQSCLGCDATNISMLFLLAYANAAGGIMNLLLVEDGAAQELRVKGGTQQLSKILADKIGSDRVVLGKPVKRIEQPDDDVVRVVTLDNETFEAGHVIVTIPPNQISQLVFEPLLPIPKQTMMASMVMGTMTKVLIIYKEPFWLKDGYSGEVVSLGGPSKTPLCEAGPISCMYDATTCEGIPALVGFVAGKNADQWYELDDAARQKAVLDQLEQYYGDRVRDLTRYIEKRWGEEPWTRGAPVCHAVPGSMHNFHALRTPHGRVRFAGTYTATEWCGYLSGAIQAGERAAAEVVEALRPEALTAEDRDMLKKRGRKLPPSGKKNYGGLLWQVVAVGVVAVVLYFLLN